MKNLKGFSFLLAALLPMSWLLSGCAPLQKQPGKEEVAVKAEKPESPESVVEEEPLGSFDPDTLYDLLVAELGGQRKRYDLALGNYLKQAHKTRDAGVAKRAYQISLFLGARQASLDASLLWAELAPDNTSAIQASAVELIRSGQLEEAVEQMRRVLDLKGEAGFDFLASSAAELGEAERKALMDSFDAILKDYPGNRSLILGKAILLQQGNRNEEALVLCNSLLKEDPDYVKALILKGRALNKLGRGEEAEKMLADAVERHPERSRLRLLYARVLVHQDKLDKARKQFQILLKQSPHDVEIILSLALIAMENHMTGEAKQYFGQLLSLGQRKNTAYYYLGRISENKKDTQQAQKYYLQVSPGKEFMMARVALTQMLVKQDKISEARALLAEARNRYPVHAVQLFLLETEVLIGRNELKEAVDLFDDAVVRHPESVNLLYGRAMVQEKLGRIDGLEKDLRQIIKMQPENAAALNALGYTLADQTDRYEEALQLIEKAYGIDNQDPAIMDSMGWINYRLGNLQEALKYLQMAYDKYPDHEVAAHLGEVLWALGRRDEARTLWVEAQKQTPDSKVLKETRERLEKTVVKNQAAEKQPDDTTRESGGK